MIFKTAALFLALLIGVGAIIPLTTDGAKAGALKPNSFKKKHKKHKKYSKRWWRAYHSRVRLRRAAEARKRALRLHRIRLANARKLSAQANNQNAAVKTAFIENSDLFILVEGKIKKILDGDTFLIENKDGKIYPVRMLGVDAPEINQSFGGQSQKKLSDLILGKNATVIIRKKDSLERFVGTIYSGGEDINLLQIETGMARYFPQNGYEPVKGDRQAYEQAERKARLARRGLWKRQKTADILVLNRR
jgi:micrococcal nuclease